MIRPGLRARVTAGFALGALIISSAMGLLSYDLTRRTLLSGRERSAVRAAYFDATVVQSGLASDEPGDVLRALDTGGSRRAAVHQDGHWFLRNADDGVIRSIPEDLQLMVTGGQPGTQRVRTDAGPAVVIGIPLPNDAQFYVVDSLSELNNTLKVLALVLTLVAGGTAVAGAALGAYTTRRALRPLASVASAARHITAGDLTARLDPTTEPDLEHLTISFNQMVDQLARRLDRDRRFAADVSHELRSPLQTLAAAASVLNRRRDKLDERTARAAGLIVDEVERFQTLVTDLLELARGDQPPELAPVEVTDLVRQLVRARRLPGSIVDAGGTPGQTWLVDRRRFEQMVANLLDNATHHGGGAVAVRIGCDGELRYLEVDDEGPGVPPRDRTAIFDRFVRGRTASSRGDSDGAGLGLALVAQHAAAHGGRVFVTDRPGGGARFRVELPGGAAVELPGGAV
jgi:two-component system, OmpR family, sensor histidine kinase MtrB